ncbi:N-hydroxyarylamine O-acetyltransferase [compost metagenome]
MTPLNPFTPQQLHACLARLELPPEAIPPTAANLDRLIDAALHHLPFENLDVLLERPVQIEPDAVFAKLVENGRGGYCFELNSLFARLLVTLGYRVTLLVARVRWGVPAEVELTQQSHLLLRVELEEGSRLVDIGFGGPAPSRSLPLVIGEELPGGWRILPGPREGELELAVRGTSGWQPLYHFSLAPQLWLDYLPRNWFTSTHPDSVFRRFLKAAISEDGVRLTLNDGQFNRRWADGQVDQRRVDDPDELIELLRERFRIRISTVDIPPLRRRLAGLLRG